MICAQNCTEERSKSPQITLCQSDALHVITYNNTLLHVRGEMPQAVYIPGVCPTEM